MGLLGTSFPKSRRRFWFCDWRDGNHAYSPSRLSLKRCQPRDISAQRLLLVAFPLSYAVAACTAGNERTALAALRLVIVWAADTVRLIL